MTKTGEGLISYLGKCNMIFNVPTHVPRPKCTAWGRFAWFNSLIEDNLAKSFHLWRIKQTLVNYSLWSLWLCELILVLQHHPSYYSKKNVLIKHNSAMIICNFYSKWQQSVLLHDYMISREKTNVSHPAMTACILSEGRDAWGIGHEAHCHCLKKKHVT